MIRADAGLTAWHVAAVIIAIDTPETTALVVIAAAAGLAARLSLPVAPNWSDLA